MKDLYVKLRMQDENGKVWTCYDTIHGVEESAAADEEACRELMEETAGLWKLLNPQYREYVGGTVISREEYEATMTVKKILHRGPVVGKMYFVARGMRFADDDAQMDLPFCLSSAVAAEELTPDERAELLCALRQLMKYCLESGGRAAAYDIVSKEEYDACLEKLEQEVDGGV